MIFIKKVAGLQTKDDEDALKIQNQAESIDMWWSKNKQTY